ncbi:DUF21 domain-containing protein At1g55930, chloroplastic-like [Primulina huaijiensis]|uniref:DUF21 domain-containing protein At1g55930, chloroplastic-like n=1 Tax=Primulina huaijiensis TaxID=1492673 RepID=UPI003CC78871
MPEGHQYETVSGFVCEAFGYIPRTCETINVILKRANREEHGEYDASESDRQDENQKSQIFKLEILEGNARKVGAVRFERKTHDDSSLNTKEFMRLVPKITRRKWSSNDDEFDRTETDEVPFKGICDCVDSF